MARRSFGGTSADFLADSAGNVQDGGTGTVWTAQTGGTQITDLLTAGGSPTTTVTAAADGASPEGLVQFQGPDDGTAVVWVSFQDDASQRVKLVASDGFKRADGEFNVKDYGAKGDGATDDTAAIQAAIDAAEAEWSTTLSAPGTVPAVHLPAGKYSHGTLTISKPIAFRGAGIDQTVLRLRAGVTTSSIVVNVTNVAGTTSDDANRATISDLQMYGNRPDAVTPGSSHGIECPDPGGSVQLGSITASDLYIDGFSGSGIYLGTRRGWAFLSNVISRYNTLNGLHVYASDHRIINCDLAANTYAGLRVTSGVGISVVGTNLNNNQYGVRFDPGSGGAIWFTNCSIGANNKDGVNIAGPGSAMGSSVTFTACQFTANSLTSTGTYSDLDVIDMATVQIIGCQFIAQTSQAKYLVKYATTGQVIFTGNALGDYAGAGTNPYATAQFNDFTKIKYTGGDTGYFGPVAGAGTVSGVLSGTEHLRFDGTYVSTFKPLKLQSPTLYAFNSSASADGKNWIIDFQTAGLQVSTLNDSLGGAVSAMRFDRSGTSITRVQFFSPVRLMQYTTAGRPTASSAGSGGVYYDTTLSKPVFSDGTTWRDAAGTAV